MPSNRQDNTDKDARLVNGYMEKELQGDSWIYKRPGFARLVRPTGASGLGQGTYNWLGDVYSIFNGHLYKGSVDKGGTINTTNGVYKFDSIMGDTPKLIFGNGIHAYAYDDTDGLVDFTGNLAFTPPFFKGWAYLDATTYMMSPYANIWGSGGVDGNDILTWDADNVLIAQIEPSRGVGIAKQLVYVIAFKENSTEVFFDAANTTGTPLGRVQGAKVNWGCANIDSVQELDGALFWLSTNRSAAIQIMKMDNLKPEIVSSPAVERLLGVADISSVYSFTLKYDGHRWYFITLRNDNLTLCYDMTTGLWAQWTDDVGDALAIVDSTYKSSTAQTILQHATDGYLYVVNSDNTVDQTANGTVPIVVDIYSPNYDAGTARDKMLQKLYFDTNQLPGSVLNVRWSDDDYQTWSTFRNADLAQKKPFLDNCGTFKRRALNLRHQRPTRFRIKSVDCQMDIGTL